MLLYASHNQTAAEATATSQQQKYCIEPLLVCVCFFVSMSFDCRKTVNVLLHIVPCLPMPAPTIAVVFYKNMFLAFTAASALRYRVHLCDTANVDDMQET